MDPDDYDVQQRMVEALVHVDEDELEAVVNALFARLPDDLQQRVERRVKFMVHPDKNSHAQATDAF